MKQLIKKLKSLFKSNKEEVVETTHKPKEIKVGKTKKKSSPHKIVSEKKKRKKK